MIEVSENLVFSLSNHFFSYVFRVSPEGILEHIHFGMPLRDPAKVPVHHLRTQREVSSHFQGIPYYSLNSTPQEFPVFGTSDYRQPGFHGTNSDGNTLFSLLYQSHQVIENKPVSADLPVARGGASQTLIVTLFDELQQLEVELYYTIYMDYSVLARSVRLKNAGKKSIQVSQLSSSAIDLPADDYEVLHLSGTWSREFVEQRHALPPGRFVVESSRGTSSSAHNPFLAVMQKGTTETFGQVYATALIYSGNFALTVERGEFEDVRLLAGINPFNFSWKLEAGKEFVTPEALHVFSGNGLRNMSNHWHTFIQDKISPEQFRHQPRPTYLNTWEAAYFDVNEAKVLELADLAQDIGVEMLVLDDGWFAGRKNDTSSLGDWVADEERFPNDIPELAKQVKARGLKFGLWFEPEMVNPESKLFTQHPDWVLQVPGRKSSLGRNQLTLDLSQQVVREYLFSQLDTLLSCGDIDYVKWDMNRNMTEVGSLALSSQQQQEVSHRYTLGLYELVSSLVQKYPDILFENCASGGNRFDLGMLSYMAQNWTSDMCDPIGRLGIVNGASYLFPLDVMAAYIGPSPNHQNGRVSSIQSRFNAGVLCSARGVSLNLEDLQEHKQELQRLMSLARTTAPDMVGGSFYRLLNNDNEVCWQYIERNQARFYLLYFHILAAPNLPFRRVRLTDLDANAEYKLVEDNASYAGDALMHSGMPLPYVATAQVNPDLRYMEKGDFSSWLFIFEKV